MINLSQRAKEAFLDAVKNLFGNNPFIKVDGKWRLMFDEIEFTHPDKAGSVKIAFMWEGKEVAVMHEYLYLHQTLSITGIVGSQEISID